MVIDNFYYVWKWKSHHASKGKQRGLDLCHVPVFEQVISFKYVVWLQAVWKNGFDEVAQVLKLNNRKTDLVACFCTQKLFWCMIYCEVIRCLAPLQINKNNHLTLCQLSLELLIFFIEPGWSLLINL